MRGHPATLTQAPLPFDSPSSIVETEFLRYLQTEDGQRLRKECVTRARKLLARGFKRFSMDAIFHSVRWDASIELGPDHGYKINDHHSSHMARHIMASCPDLAGFFEVRELRGRAWRKRRAP